MKTVWVDLLCFSSVFKIFFLSRKTAIKEIIYINRTKYLHSFTSGLLKLLVNKPLKQMDWIALADEKIDGESLYELVQLKLIDVLEEWLSKEDIVANCKEFCEKNDYSYIKFKEHLREFAYWQLFRSVETSVLAQKVSGEDSIFVFHGSPFNRAVKTFIKEDQAFFYYAWLITPRSIDKREEYHYDGVLFDNFFANRFTSVGWMWILFVSSLISSLLCKFINSKTDKDYMKNANIGVDLLMGRIRFNEPNDLYWIKESTIDPKTVWGIEHEDYSQKSKDILRSLGLRRCKILKNPLRFVSIVKKGPDKDCRYLSIGFWDCLKATSHFLRLFLSFLRWNEYGWLQYMKARYAWSILYYESIYKQLGLRILWSMYDVDFDKLPKAQALEHLNGFYAGSHRSNPCLGRVDIQKCYDVLVAWGPHFERNIYNRYPNMAVFEAGYPTDYYFNSDKANALKSDVKYSKRFVLSYQDSGMAQDVMFSKKMHVQVNQMLITLLEENPNLIVILKPKKKFVLDKMIQELPQLQKYIDEGRIEVFLNYAARSRVIPVAVGKISDLVVGMGTSTAAAECLFAGTTAFHAEFTGFERNDFAQAGLNKIVFRNVESLKQAINEQIRGKGISLVECRKYHECLDPFQDGKAYQRTGYILKSLQEGLQDGLNRKDVIEKSKRDYDLYTQKPKVLEEVIQS